MARRLPPFAALRAFEATARLGSVRAAAEELCVTQSAVSHQLRAFEDWAGRALFSRAGQGIEPTGEGRAYLAEVTPLLDRLEAESARLLDRATGRLRIRSTPGFANRWLIPRLGEIAEACPGLELEVSTGMPPKDASCGTFDVLIHWGTDPLPGAVVEPFFASPRFAVAAPSLLAERGWPDCPDDLARFTLVHDVYGDRWDDWVRAAGGVAFDHRPGPRFEHCDLSMSAVAAGQGIGLGYALVIERELARGELVRVLDVEIGPFLIHSLAWPETAGGCPRVGAFRSWILATAGAQERRAAERSAAPLRHTG